MLTEERYLALLNEYIARDIPAGSVMDKEVTLNELTKLFHCTERNVKLIVRKLEEEELIVWHPGRGRGNRSRIEFRVPRDEFLLQYAQRLADKGEYRTAFEVLNQYEEDQVVLDQFMKWLNGQFGYSEEENSNSAGCIDLFRLPVYRAPLTLDPANLFHSFDAHLTRQIFDRLVQYESDENSKVVPMLAHHWESNDDGTQWVFHLRKGVRFHHKRELTAHDVVFTFNRLRNRSMNEWLLFTMDRVEALNPITVKIVLKQPNWLLPRMLCSACAAILPADLVSEDEEKFWRMPIGTGAFRLTHWSSNLINLSVNTEYFLGRAYLDAVNIVILPEEIPGSSRLRWEKLIDNEARFPSKPEKDWNQIESFGKNCSLISWNRNKPGPQQSLSFRQAVNLIIDRRQLIQDVERGAPARGFLPREERLASSAFRYDRDAALQLLQESGYDGTPLDLITTLHQSEDASWFAEQCASVGINVRINYVTVSECSDEGIGAEADCILTCLAFADDEVCQLETYLQSQSFIYNHMEHNLRRWIFGIAKEILATASIEARSALFQQIEFRLQDEAQFLFLVHRKINTYVHPSIRGIGINRLGWMDFKDIWLTSPICDCDE
ncbi:ABC transporter substrate-binding protein [Paenibacillus woosongensis]|uniref:ABC transporter substrate-binding protein n=1 Tax=Paenibacillus woosongensis TaxID=307580 RepID=A0ABQ4MK62_9BACL|nr:ABC transporter substrate-binding protein [Paenibacillus woosongensis]GIP56354.1 ABC transporter substrate-binding protein [Paenibacillus woosongensis]